MIVQLVQFDSTLSEAECTKVARAREARYAATPGLIQKYYLKGDKPNHYAGILIWDSKASMAAFRETELAQTVPTAYAVVGAPQVTISEMMFPLRPEAMPDKLQWTA